MTGARTGRGAIGGAAVIGIRGAAGILAGIFGIFGIFGAAVFGSLPLAIAFTPVS